MNANVTALLLRGIWKFEGHGSGTTTLCVLDNRAAGRARGSLLAGRSVCHAIQEIDFGIKRDGDLHAGDGEGFVGAMRDLRTILRIGSDRSGDAFALPSLLASAILFLPYEAVTLTVRDRRMSRLSRGSLTSNPENEKPPKVLNCPKAKFFQSKPSFCSPVQILLVLEGEEKDLALVQP